jgi:hypothetical protein
MNPMTDPDDYEPRLESVRTSGLVLVTLFCLLMGVAAAVLVVVGLIFIL